MNKYLQLLHSSIQKHISPMCQLQEQLYILLEYLQLLSKWAP
nr:MAG TPA: hypothetical protein [Caudoviricetes sp.]